ncbi:MAG: outer membrane protein transport protein [Marinobacter sp.]|uniref:outer membrane protein transport protein n=1 Tax=Marinobacter sp. TaxID=50741 RepID=UPI00299D2888|nr:outer membrane protein transport protein [Marinobacter sp.]MDX1755990.1 outer membrane protein transport protein [Marinobacter sp.]
MVSALGAPPPRFSRVSALSVLVTALAAPTAMASMGNLGSTYGVLPSDLASAQALSMFNTQVSANFYNPAYLATDPRGELTTGILHAQPDLEARGASGTLSFDKESQHVLIGMKTDLSSMLRSGPPIYLGFIAGLEKYGKEMLAFNARTSETGQFLQYGRQPLFLNLGGASNVWRGINVGASARITLHASAELRTVSDLAGNTEQEKLTVNAEPSIRLIYSASANLGDTLCPDSDCLLDGWEVAAAYRTSSDTNTTVDAGVVIPGLIPASDPLEFTVKTYDSYQPETLSLGLQYLGDGWRVGGSVEQQNWSDLTDKFEGDNIRDQAGVQFDDTLVPRLGAEYQLSQHFAVTAGVAYQESPLEDGLTPDVNYYDNDRVIVGLGLTAEYDRTRILAYPLRLDLGYQYHRMDDRDFTLSAVGPGETVTTGDTVTAGGEVHVVAGSLTLKF